MSTYARALMFGGFGIGTAAPAATVKNRQASIRCANEGSSRGDGITGNSGAESEGADCKPGKWGQSPFPSKWGLSPSFDQEADVGDAECLEAAHVEVVLLDGRE